MKKIPFLLLLLFAGCSLLHAQEPSETPVPFNGVITEASGKGVKARIMVKRSKAYTVADKSGKFGLTDVQPTDTLVVEFKNDKALIPVEGRQSMRILWLEERPAVEEDQALADQGMDYVKRREHGPGVSGLTGERMRQLGYTDLVTAIVNLVPGVTLVNGEIAIRGIASVNSGTSPLIVCDGVPVSSLRNISVFDVESVEVQKGSNMYGLRGANGVILVRTRK